MSVWVRVVSLGGFNVILGVVAFAMAARADRKAKTRERVRLKVVRWL